MRRFTITLLALFASVTLLPPLYYTAFPPPEPSPLPPEGKRVVLPDGLAVNVVEKGEGQPILLVHGLPGTAYDWRLLVDELASRGFRALAYDRVGYGRSDARAEDEAHSVQANAREMEQLIEVLELEDPTIVAWSYGGAMALTSAMSGSTNMSRLVLVGTAGPDSADAEPPDGPPAFVRFLYSDPVLAWRSRVPPVTRGMIEAASAQAFSRQPQPDWWLPSVEANFSRWDTLQTFKKEMFHPIHRDWDARRIDIPTLLIHGDADQNTPVGVSRYLVSVIPDAEAVFIEQGSHMLPVTHPELLADVITTFAAGRSPMRR